MKKLMIISLMFFVVLYMGVANATIYYVNDNSTNGDKWCTAVGNDTNNGLSVSTPKLTIGNLLSSYTITNGDEIRIDKGSYGEQVDLTGDDTGSPDGYLTLIGAGTNDPGSGTGTKIDGGGSRTYCFNLIGRRKIKIKNMRINASKGGANIYINRCTNIMITNCKIYQAFDSSTTGGYAIHIDNNSIQNKIINNVIGDNTDPNYSTGIKIENNSDYNLIEGNKVYKNNTYPMDWNGGILVMSDSDYVKIANNQIYSNNKFYNILLENTTKSTVVNNTIYQIINGSGDYQCNIRMNNADNCVIRNNQIYDAPYYGIYMEGGSTTNLINCNNIHNNGRSGIYIVNSSGYNSINSNLVNNNGYSGDSDQNKCGIFIGDGSSYCRLFRNISSKNNNDGLRTQDTGGGACVGTAVINNTFFNNGGRGVLFDNNSTSCTLRNNIAESNGNAGFLRVANATGLTQSYNNSYGNSGNNFNFQGDTLGAGTISSNSMFISTTPSSSNFLHLNFLSPCINKGDPDDPAPFNGGARVDIGRYEFITTQPSSAPNITGDVKSANEIRLNWNKVEPFVTSYSLFRSGNNNISSASNITNVIITTANSNLTSFIFSDTGVQISNIYYYWIKANNPAGSSPYSSVISNSTYPPSAPNWISATVVSSNEIDLSWNDLPNETSYTLFRNTNNNSGTASNIGGFSANVTSYNDTSLTTDTTYYYWLKAYNPIGSSGFSSVISNSTYPPSAPNWISATVVSSNEIDLSWNDLPNETSYTLFRNTNNNSGTASNIGGFSANVTSYNDTSLTTDTTYYYWLKAYNPIGSSGFSSVISNTTFPSLPSAPIWISATVISPNEIDLLWHTATPKVTSYTLFRSVYNNISTASNISGFTYNITNYKDTKLSEGTTYYYWLRAYNLSGPSVFSTVISNTTIAVENLKEFQLVKLEPKKIFTPYNNEEMRFYFKIPKENEAKCVIYTLNGSKIKTLSKKMLSDKDGYFFWDGKDKDSKICSSGVYIYQLECNDKKINGTVVLVK